MRLSQAIRLGIGAVKENRSVYLTNEEFNDPCGCAIGTAMYAIGNNRFKWINSYGINECHRVWPWTKQVMPQEDRKSIIDGGLKEPHSIAYEISLRHSGYIQSREQIADWVERLENKLGIIDGQVGEHLRKEVIEESQLESRIG